MISFERHGNDVSMLIVAKADLMSREDAEIFTWYEPAASFLYSVD